MKISDSLLIVGLLIGATGAAALSLGEVRESVVMGRPLDVLIDVRPDPGTTLDPACLTATATVGDTHIDSSRIQISVLPAADSRVQTVRVRSRVVVNEPILTVQLTAGCTSAMSRTYQVLADPPGQQVAGALPVLPAMRKPNVDPVIASGAAPRADTGSAPRVRTQSAPKRVASDATARVAPVVKRSDAPPRSAKPAAPVERAMAAPTSRLLVEPLEDWLLLPAALRLSSDLQALPSPEPTPERAQAAEHWKSLNTSSDESADRTLAISTEAAAARAATAQAAAAASALQERVDRLEAERFSPTLVYALLALLAATLAGWGWYAVRTRRHAAAATADWSDAVAANAARETEGEGVPSRQGRASANTGLRDEDLEFFLEGEDSHLHSTPPAAMAPAKPARVDPPVVAAAPALVVAPVATMAAAAPATPPVQVVQPEDLFDLQQQAEFFISVGEHDQAIEVMSRHIDENHAASPWAYLELLRLYRSLSRVGPFNQLREQFQQHFNAQVPVFAAFHHVNRVLLDYPEVLAGVEALWSDNAVLPLLESLLFCGKATAPMERFDLSAYDDLLMLYAIASTTQASARGLPPPRPRTTPVADAEQPASLVPPARLDLEELDSLIPSPPPEPSPSFVQTNNMIEYDDLQVSQHGTPPEVVLPDQELDIDLSEPDWTDSLRLPALTLSDLPAMPVTAAPASGQPVGFGANSDRVEARFDLEERKP